MVSAPAILGLGTCLRLLDSRHTKPELAVRGGGGVMVAVFERGREWVKK